MRFGLGILLILIGIAGILDSQDVFSLYEETTVPAEDLPPEPDEQRKLLTGSLRVTSTDFDTGETVGIIVLDGQRVNVNPYVNDALVVGPHLLEFESVAGYSKTPSPISFALVDGQHIDFQVRYRKPLNPNVTPTGSVRLTVTTVIKYLSGYEVPLKDVRVSVDIQNPDINDPNDQTSGISGILEFNLPITGSVEPIVVRGFHPVYSSVYGVVVIDHTYSDQDTFLKISWVTQNPNFYSIAGGFVSAEVELMLSFLLFIAGFVLAGPRIRRTL